MGPTGNVFKVKEKKNSTNFWWRLLFSLLIDLWCVSVCSLCLFVALFCPPPPCHVSSILCIPLSTSPRQEIIAEDFSS